MTQSSPQASMLFAVAQQQFDHFHLGLVYEQSQVVMGIAEGAKRDQWGYGAKGVSRFCQSLFDSGFDGFVVIATDASEQQKRQLARKFSGHKLILLNLDDTRAGFVKSIHAKELRYYLYYQWARMFLHPQTLFLLTDIRDVYFQENPFGQRFWKDIDTTADLFFFAESDSIVIGNSTFTSSWVRNCFGRSELERLSNRPVLCSGTTFGTTNAIRSYSKLMIDFMASPPRAECRKPIHDQVFHNFLHYNGLFGVRTRVFAQGEGPANNIGQQPTYKFFDEVSKKVLNRDGTASALVHQFDRYEQLRKLSKQMISSQ